MIREMGIELDLPQDAAEYFVASWERLQKDPEAVREFTVAQECYFRSLAASIAHLQTVADLTGISIHTVHYLLAMSLLPSFRKTCEALGVPEEIYRETLSDLRGKIFECYDRYGVYGTFVLFWYCKVFTCRVLRIGRLEFEPETWRSGEYSPTLKNGTPTFHVHILTGDPFTPESVLDSLRRAYAFYHVADTPSKMMVIECSSWLLYPPTAALYKKGGNLENFYNLFDVYSESVSKGYGSAWRVFGEQPNEELSNLKEDNSMRRAFAAYLRAGGTMGTGKGVFFFDGEKILPHENGGLEAAFRRKCEPCRLPPEALDDAASAYMQLVRDPVSGALFQKAKNCFFADPLAAEKLLCDAAKQANVSENRARGAFVLSLIPSYRTVCSGLSIPRAVADETLTDLKSKFCECRAFCGEWGVLPGLLRWYVRLLSGRIVRLGRLEFEQAKWGTENQGPYRSLLRRGDLFWRVHIPSGDPLTPESVDESLRRAYEFFAIGETEEKLLKLQCSSWILSARVTPLFRPGSNLKAFADRFDVIFDCDSPGKDEWRVFGVRPNETLSNLPQTTELQRSLAAHLRAGGRMGFARGVLIFDGERAV